jgi:hypothetical protein
MAEPRQDVLASMIVDGYLEQLGGWSGDLHWTWSIVEELVRGRPDIAWPLLLEMIRRCPDDAALSLLAAGPLEDYLAAHAGTAIDVVEAEAARNQRLRRALGLTWKRSIPDAAWARILAIREPEPDAGPEVPEGWMSNALEVRLGGLPPMRPGSTDPADVAARGRLAAAALEAKPDGPAPWATPVSVEVHLETGPEPLPAPTIDVLAAVIEALAGEGAVIADRSLVRIATITELRGAEALAIIDVRRMPEDQVEALDDTRPMEEQLDAPEIRGIAEELALDWPPPAGAR